MKYTSVNNQFCAHYASKYLHVTQNWIYQILVNHSRYKPIFLAREKMYLTNFPFPKVFSLDDFRFLRRMFELLFYKTFGYFFFCRKVCTARSVSIIHAHFGYHGMKMLGLKKKLGVPMVCSFYGDDAYANIHNRFNGYAPLFQNAELILVLGPTMKHRLMELGCSEKKLRIHHLGIDVNSIPFKQHYLDSTTKTVKFLIVAGFVEKKGIDIAIHALEQISLLGYDFTLEIIGDGPLRGKLMDLIAASSIHDKICLHGYKPYSFFIERALACDIFIQASRTGVGNEKEGTPMAIVDAMAAGMPIITTNHSDIPEIVKNNIHGYVAKENDVQSLADCLLKLLTKPERVSEFSRNARLWIEQEFNAVRQTEILETYYEEVIKAYLDSRKQDSHP